MTGSPPAPQLYTFEQMNLQVGMRVQFITHRTLRPIQHFSTVIGWIRDEYLIVKTPFEHNNPIALREGEKLTLRVFSGVNVCSFSCVAERVFGRPLCYAHVTFPTEIQGTNLRTAMRVKVDIPAHVRGSNGEQTGFLVNLSVSGALLESKMRLPDDAAPVTVEFTLLTQPDNRQVMIATKAVIRNVSVVEGIAGGAQKFSYGLQFTDLEAAHYMMLQNLTYEALLADRQKIV